VETEEKEYNVFNDLRSKLKGTSIYLVGMMGSGKTSVGNELAQQMGYRFLDTDHIAEYMIEMPISEFFNQGNEDEFRKVEYQVLMELSQYMRVIVSTGGGIVLKNENWGLLRHGIVIFLDLSPENIYNRLKTNPIEMQRRPLLQSADPLEKLTELHKIRYEKYMQSDVRIEVNPHASVKQVAVDTAEGIVAFINNNPPTWQEWKRKRDATAVEAAARVSE
jgi:shikimate kinase